MKEQFSTQPRMDVPTASYIAGLMDGEGCFRIERFASAASPIGFQYRGVAEIAMCDREPIEFIAKHCTRHIQVKKIKSGRTVYLIIWRNGFARDLIIDLMPYLHGKREQAEICLYFETYIAPGRGRTYTAEDRIKCDHMRDLCASLKKFAPLH
ncbi:MAG: hypothetical protein ACXWC3_24700 [Burkholderiales bacterium]